MRVPRGSVPTSPHGEPCQRKFPDVLQKKMQPASRVEVAKNPGTKRKREDCSQHGKRSAAPVKRMVTTPFSVSALCSCAVCARPHREPL